MSRNHRPGRTKPRCEGCGSKGRTVRECKGASLGRVLLCAECLRILNQMEAKGQVKRGA